MKKAVTALVMATAMMIGIASSAHAEGPSCEDTDSVTSESSGWAPRGEDNPPLVPVDVFTHKRVEINSGTSTASTCDDAQSTAGEWSGWAPRGEDNPPLVPVDVFTHKRVEINSGASTPRQPLGRT